MSDPIDVQIARMDERLATVLKELQRAEAGRKQQYEKIEDLDKKLIHVSNRIDSVEGGLARAKPTIDEFITIKHKVVGAGVFGKWLWMAFGALVGLFAASRSFVLEWLAK